MGQINMPAYSCQPTSLPHNSQPNLACITRHQRHHHCNTMGLIYNEYLDAKVIYGCKECKAHLADQNEIISRVGLID